MGILPQQRKFDKSLLKPHNKVVRLLPFFIIIFFILLTLPVSATHKPCHLPSATPAPRVIEGLPSSQNLVNVSSSTGECVKDDRAVFVSYKLPSYEDLKSIYYTQSKANKGEIGALSVITDQTVYHTTGDLTLDLALSGSGTAVIFVEGNLNIPQNITYGGPNTGLVFIVKGDINIFRDFTRVDAILISQGTICTAFDGTSCPNSNITVSQLIINGSLISLAAGKPIKFRRALTDNSLPAEKIVYQPKYLVILRSLLADTYQKWSEI